MNWNEQIKKARQTAGLTQQQTANSLQIKQPNYARIESGKVEPPLKKLIAICEVLNCKISLPE